MAVVTSVPIIPQDRWKKFVGKPYGFGAFFGAIENISYLISSSKKGLISLAFCSALISVGIFSKIAPFILYLDCPLRIVDDERIWCQLLRFQLHPQ